MKKFTFALMALLSMTFMVKAQQYVSTAPANRNVILEEFTGRNCGYCPDGHRIANEIMANNPGRVWAINVHAGGYAPTTYPNLRCDDGLTIHNGFDTSYGYPSGVINRSSAASQGRGVWANLSNQQLNQAAECNVAGFVRINPNSRVATITVEVYYTGNSTVTENYLTVAMLQDSIMGSQSGMTSNPAQVVNGTYCHMHILRDVITPSAWGEAISPTTAGTLITKTYEYQIPDIIGSPNGVEVDLNNIFFLAWVSEKQQGSATRPILNACELGQTFMTEEPIYPSMSAVAQAAGASCSQEKEFAFNVTNIGTETLTSIKFNAQIAGMTDEFEWTGELLSGEGVKMSFFMEIPFGTFNGSLNITEANGQPFEAITPITAVCQEWTESEYEGDVTLLKIYIVQDQFGEQTTWDLTNSAGEVIAQGGPYQHLLGQGSTQVNLTEVPNVPTDECYMFSIYDSSNNGICCNYGNGSYYIKDENGDRIVDGDGNFGYMAQNCFMLKKRPDAINDNFASNLHIYPNPANSQIFVEGENVNTVEIYNSLGQMMLSVEGSANTTSLNVSSFENGVYVVRVITEDGVTTRKVSINR